MSNAANRTRIMKWADFSHNKPRIFLPKIYITALARIIKVATGINHRIGVTLVGNCFCGVDSNFGEYHQPHRYDLDISEALIKYPNVLTESIDMLSERTGIVSGFIRSVINLDVRQSKGSGLEYLDWQTLLEDYKNEHGSPPWVIACDQMTGDDES